MLIAAVPYCPNGKGSPPGRDLGYACNLFYERCLQDEDWGCILDHDLAVVTPRWTEIVEEAIATKLDAGCFTFKISKGPPGSRWQIAPGVDSKRHDLPSHIGIAERELKVLHTAIDVTENEKLPGGYALGGLMVIQKKTWDSVGGFPNGAKFVDWGMQSKIRHYGLKVYLLPQIYVYHWGRGDIHPSY
jgi:GT2 family glycosyltransferase